MADHFDLIVIGAGPAGAQGAALAASLGQQVALVEREPYLGGAGLTTGTMPSKMLREAAVTLSVLRQRALAPLAYTLQPGTRLSDLMYNKDVVVDAAWGSIQHNFERHHIRVVHGAATFKDPHTVSVSRPTEGQPVTVDLTAGTILIATGSAPVHPANFPFEHPQVRDAESILSLERLPRSVAVVGGGTIGCEYASIFNALGVPVTLVEPRQRLLDPVDAELARRWQQFLTQLGVRFLLEADVTQVELPTAGQAGDVRLSLRRAPPLAVEVVLVAVGRQGRVAGLNLEAAGLAVNGQGFLDVNDHFQTRVPHLYAAGDVVGWPALASTAMEQARTAMTHACQQADAGSSRVYPFAVYTIPEIAMVGLSEEACRQQNLPYAVGRAYLEDNPHAQMTGDTSGLLKLLFVPADRRLLGVHLMCPGASDLIHLGAYVLATGGSLDAFTQAVFNYPTLSEAYRAAALDGLDHLRRRAEASPEDPAAG